MKKLIYVVLTLLLMTGCNQQTEPDGITANGTPVHLSKYAGKWVIVNYWATWCEPCLKEMPELQAFYTKYKDTTMVLGVAFEPLSRPDIVSFAHSLELTFPMLSHFNLEKFGVDPLSTVPATLIFSPAGKLVKVLYGPQTKESLLHALST